MSEDIAKQELAATPKTLIYKTPVHQLACAQARRAKRRVVEAYQGALKRKSMARSAAKRLLRAIAKSDDPVSDTVLDIYQKMVRIGDTRVVGPHWRKPRDGRRL